MNLKMKVALSNKVFLEVITDGPYGSYVALKRIVPHKKEPRGVYYSPKTWKNICVLIPQIERHLSESIEMETCMISEYTRQVINVKEFMGKLYICFEKRNENDERLFDKSININVDEFAKMVNKMAEITNKVENPH